MINITNYLYIRITICILTEYWSMDYKDGKNINRGKIQIYHSVLNIDSEYHTTLFLITEIENGEVKRTYCFKIPRSYLDDSLLGEINEKYCLFCPN